MLAVGEIVQVLFHDHIVGGYDPQLPDKEITAQPIAVADSPKDSGQSVTLRVLQPLALRPHDPDAKRGEVEGLELTLTFLRSKREQARRAAATGTVSLGIAVMSRC